MAEPLSSPSFTLARIILFTLGVPTTAAFYNRLFGLPILGDGQDGDFIELDAGGCRLAIHRGSPPEGCGRAPKIVFRADKVAQERARLIGEGVTVGTLMEGSGFAFFDARDPAGNPFQISNRP